MTTLAHYIMDNANLAGKTVANAQGVAPSLTLNAAGTYTLVDTPHNAALGGPTKRKTITGAGLSSGMATATFGIVASGEATTVELVFRLTAAGAFEVQFVRSGTTRFEFHVAVVGDDPDDCDIAFTPIDIFGSNPDGHDGERLITRVQSRGIARIGDLCHLAFMVDARSTKPKFESYLNGQQIGFSQSTRDLNSAWNGSSETFSLLDEGGDATFSSFAEILIHNTPLTAAVARRHARRFIQLQRIIEV